MFHFSAVTFWQLLRISQGKVGYRCIEFQIIHEQAEFEDSVATPPCHLLIFRQTPTEKGLVENYCLNSVMGGTVTA